MALGSRLIAFVRDVTRFAEREAEADVRRLLCSPFGGVPAVDARAICTIARERGGIAATVEREAVSLDRESLLAARRFLAALDDVRRAHRAQGATAREHVATVALAFDFEHRLNVDERAAFASVADAAARIDAAGSPGIAWDEGALLAELERIGAQRDASAPPRPSPAPLVRRDPETPHDVKRRQGHFSASSLATFAECERRWYYRYVCTAVEDPGSPASFYGSAFHWALERFHGEIRRADAAPPELLEAKLDAYVVLAFERYRGAFATNVEYKLQLRRARRTARRYVAWFLERAQRRPFSVVGTETEVELELDGHAFIGYIDRLDRDDATGEITVVDYKTGSIPQSAADYRAKVARFVDFQLPFYYWARTAVGDRVARLALVPLKDAALDVTPLELEVVPVPVATGYGDSPSGTIGVDELERARAAMGALAHRLADGPFEHFSVTSDASACTFCAYATACRSKPLLRDDRFGR